MSSAGESPAPVSKVTSHWLGPHSVSRLLIGRPSFLRFSHRRYEGGPPALCLCLGEGGQGGARPLPPAASGRAPSFTGGGAAPPQPKKKKPPPRARRATKTPPRKTLADPADK